MSAGEGLIGPSRVATHRPVEGLGGLPGNRGHPGVVLPDKGDPGLGAGSAAHLEALALPRQPRRAHGGAGRDRVAEPAALEEPRGAAAPRQGEAADVDAPGLVALGDLRVRGPQPPESIESHTHSHGSRGGGGRGLRSRALCEWTNTHRPYSWPGRQQGLI